MLDASIYVLPSLFEGTPLTLMESMATGLVPVVTDTCGMKDVVVDREKWSKSSIRDPARLAEAIISL